MLYLCICVLVFVYLCMRHLVISVLISLDQELSENVWFVWSKTSQSGDVTDAGGQATREDTATQLLICESLSLATMRVRVSGRWVSAVDSGCPHLSENIGFVCAER